VKTSKFSLNNLLEYQTLDRRVTSCWCIQCVVCDSNYMATSNWV